MPPIAGLLYQGAEVSMGALPEEIESEEDVAQVRGRGEGRGGEGEGASDDVLSGLFGEGEGEGGAGGTSRRWSALLA